MCIVTLFSLLDFVVHFVLVPFPFLLYVVIQCVKFVLGENELVPLLGDSYESQPWFHF